MNRLLITISILLNIFAASTALSEEIVVATGHTFIKRVFEPIRAPFRDKTGIEIRIIYGEPSSFLASLENGSAELAGASMPLNEWMEAGRKANVPIHDASKYSTYIPVSEKTLIVVNSKNSVSTLSKEQLKGIFTGKIKNWKEVGGGDVPILVVWPSVNAGALLMVKSRIMDNEPLLKTFFDVETIGDVSGAIIATPEAIGVVTEISTENELKTVAPAIERPLILLYKDKPSPNLKKFLDFLKSDGKKYIK